MASDLELGVGELLTNLKVKKKYKEAGAKFPPFFLILKYLSKIEVKMLNKITLIILFTTSTLLMSSCRQEEQNRILNYEKGVYLGKKDEPLTEKQITKLRMHTSRQSSY